MLIVGHLFILDRTNGDLVLVKKFARATWGDIDPLSGKVNVRLMPSEKGVEICPGPAGAKEWPHAAYNPDTGILYTPVVEACADFKLMHQEFMEGMAYWGGRGQSRGQAAMGSTGEVLWSFQTGSGIHSNPITYAVDGKQYVAVPTGWGGWLEGFAPKMYGAQRGSALFVFALP